jgi:hypothetical protein
MEWQKYLRELVPKVAGAAAGAAAAVGGPVGAAAAAKAASTTAEQLLAEFVGAQADQLDELVRLNREMNGRLAGLQQGVDSLLDADWKTALLHIEDASRSPARRATDLENARLKLFDAWGKANTAYRRQAIAEHMAALFAMLGEAANVRYWLEVACVAHSQMMADETRSIHDTLLERIKQWRRWQSILRQQEQLYVVVWTTRLKESDPLYVASPDHPSGLVYRNKGDTVLSHYDDHANHMCMIPRESALERQIAALAELDAAGQTIRASCIDAGIPPTNLPPDSWAAGASRVVRGRSTLVGRISVLVIFGQTVAAEVCANGGHSPLAYNLPPRYANVETRPIISYYEELVPNREIFKRWK